jgi:hypothetical protein
VDDCNKVSSQIEQKLNTKTESDNTIGDHIKYVHQTLDLHF